MKTVCFYIHGTINTTGIKFFEPVFHAGAGTLAAELFTGDGSHQLIPFSDAPECVKPFHRLCSTAFIDDGDRYYFQWSGRLGEDAWEEASAHLADEITRIASGEPIQVLIIGHSHGANVARLTAEKIHLTETAATFHMVSIAMPLASDPATIMPANVPTWLHYYNDRDPTQWLGGWLMANGSACVRTIEDVFVHAEGLGEKPEGWQSTRVTSYDINPHSELVSNAELAMMIVGYASEMIFKAFNPQLAAYVPPSDPSEAAGTPPPDPLPGAAPPM